MGHGDRIHKKNITVMLAKWVFGLASGYFLPRLWRRHTFLLEQLLQLQLAPCSLGISSARQVNIHIRSLSF